MQANSIKDEDMAARLSCDRSYVVKLRAGSKVPSHSMMALIAEKTDGEVQPNDFFELPGEAAAA